MNPFEPPAEPSAPPVGPLDRALAIIASLGCAITGLMVTIGFSALSLVTLTLIDLDGVPEARVEDVQRIGPVMGVMAGLALAAIGGLLWMRVGVAKARRGDLSAIADTLQGHRAALVALLLLMMVTELSAGWFRRMLGY